MSRESCSRKETEAGLTAQRWAALHMRRESCQLYYGFFYDNCTKFTMQNTILVVGVENNINQAV